MKNFKKLFASLLCALMCLGVFATAANAADQKPAKTVKAYEYIGKKWVLKYTEKNTYKNGSLKSTVTTYPDSKNTYKTTYSNSKNKSVVKRYFNGKLDYSSTSTYKKGWIVKSVYKGSDGYTSTSTYSYNKKKTKATCTYKSSGGYKQTSTLYYDKKGRLTKETWKDDWGTGTSTYKYNKKGQQTQSSYSYKDKEGYYNTDTTKNYYFTSGKKKGLLKKTTYSWSNSYKEKGSSYTSYSYKLNTNGTVKERIATSSDGSKTKYVYKY